MKFQFEDTRPEIASESILDDLRRVAEELGMRRVPQNRYRESGRFSSFLVKKRFGSWNRALTAAGLDLDDSRRHIPDDELFDNLRAAWIALGRQPRKGEMAPPVSRFGHDPYIRRFGGWLAAMRAFVDSQGLGQRTRRARADRRRCVHSSASCGAKVPSNAARRISLCDLWPVASDAHRPRSAPGSHRALLEGRPHGVCEPPHSVRRLQSREGRAGLILPKRRE